MRPCGLDASPYLVIRDALVHHITTQAAAVSAWVLAEDWLTAVGLSMLTLGTGAQAWANLSEYRDLLKRLPKEVTDALVLPLAFPGLFENMFPPLRPMSRRRKAWFVAQLIPWGLWKAATAVPRTLAQLRREGGDNGARAAELARLAVVWTVLMIGSGLASAAAVIQIALAYN